MQIFERGDHLAEIEVRRPRLDAEPQAQRKVERLAQILEPPGSPSSRRATPRIWRWRTTFSTPSSPASAIPFSAQSIASVGLPPSASTDGSALVRENAVRPPAHARGSASPHGSARELERSGRAARAHARARPCPRAAACSSPAERSAATASSYACSASGSRPCSLSASPSLTRTTARAGLFADELEAIADMTPPPRTCRGASRDRRRG